MAAQAGGWSGDLHFERQVSLFVHNCNHIDAMGENPIDDTIRVTLHLPKIPPWSFTDQSACGRICSDPMLSIKNGVDHLCSVVLRIVSDVVVNRLYVPLRLLRPDNLHRENFSAFLI